MKRLMAAALSLALLGGTAASASPQDHRGGPDRHGDRNHGRDRDRHDNGHHYGDYRRPDDHRWARGERLPQAYWTRGQYVDYRHHHLRQPPRGYQWVQVNDNYILIALTSGLISQIIAGGR